MRLLRILTCGVAVLAAGAVPSDGIAAIDGRALRPFAPARSANVLFFVTSDCPISNAYAPEIQRICRDYAARGVACTLMYEDLKVDAATVRQHLAEFRYHDIPAAIDSARLIAMRANATVTPQAVVVDRAGAVRYRGRIDNLYTDVGRTRQQVTAHDVRDALDAVIAGRPVRTAETEAFGCSIIPPDVLKDLR